MMLSDVAVRRPVLTAVAAIVLCVIGAAAFFFRFGNIIDIKFDILIVLIDPVQLDGDLFTIIIVFQWRGFSFKTYFLKVKIFGIQYYLIGRIKILAEGKGGFPDHLL